MAFASIATLRTCKSLRGALRSHSSTLIVCFLSGMDAAGADACEADEIDKDEGRCPRRPELLMFDVRFIIMRTQSRNGALGLTIIT